MIKVVFFTGNRAEFGLIDPIIQELNLGCEFEITLLVSGDHLNGKIKKSFDEIKHLKIKKIIQVPIKLSDDSNIGAINYIGDAIKSYSKILIKIKPDFMFVYADRFEGFAAVIASSLQNLATIHMEGGDVTEGGAHDDNIRHAMTKLSHIHLATNHQAYNRILAMGEEAWRVFDVGLPAMDQIKNSNYLNEAEIKKIIPIQKKTPIILFTQHSLASDYQLADEQIEPSLQALECCLNDGLQVIITYPNNDPGGERIINKLEAFKKKHNDNTNLHVYSSLGRKLFHGLLALVQSSFYNLICVGNSSSGIKEAVLFEVAAVNIGDRQKGRLKSINVIDVNYDKQQILSGINKALYDKIFNQSLKNIASNYGDGNTAASIKKIIYDLSFKKDLTRKKMSLVGSQLNGWFK